MLEQYDKWVDQVRFALEKWGSYRVDGSFRTVVVNGMGGSGIVGDYLAVLNDHYGGVPIRIYKSHIPPSTLADDLVIAISYSGNTHETLVFLKKILERGVKAVLVSSNGILEKIGVEKNLVFIKIPEGYVPRTSLPTMLINVLSLLSSSGLSRVDKLVVSDALRDLESSLSLAKSIGEKLADHLHSTRTVPILASHSPYEPLLVRAKNEFSENSKLHVRVEIAPECFHNDIVGWEKPLNSDQVAVVVKDKDDKVGSSLIEYLVATYREKGVYIFEVSLLGTNMLSKLLYGSLVFGYASVYLAHLRGVDPLLTESIRRYKSFIDSLLGFRKI